MTITHSDIERAGDTKNPAAELRKRLRRFLLQMSRLKSEPGVEPGRAVETGLASRRFAMTGY